MTHFRASRRLDRSVELAYVTQSPREGRQRRHPADPHRSRRAGRRGRRFDRIARIRRHHRVLDGGATCAGRLFWWHHMLLQARRDGRGRSSAGTRAALVLRRLGPGRTAWPGRLQNRRRHVRPPTDRGSRRRLAAPIAVRPGKTGSPWPGSNQEDAYCGGRAAATTPSYATMTQPQRLTGAVDRTIRSPSSRATIPLDVVSDVIESANRSSRVWRSEPAPPAGTGTGTMSASRSAGRELAITRR